MTTQIGPVRLLLSCCYNYCTIHTTIRYTANFIMLRRSSNENAVTAYRIALVDLLKDGTSPSVLDTAAQIRELVELQRRTKCNKISLNVKLAMDKQQRNY